MSRIRLLLLLGAALPLAACGADDVASPGEGGIITPTPTPTPTPAPTPTPTPPTTVTPGTCPTGPWTDGGTITGPTGTWRVCNFPARFTADTQVPKVAGVLYALPGRVDVGTDQGAASTNNVVTLTIDPGVIIFGATGVSYLAVNRGNRIYAVGSPTQPIIFTGRGNVTGAVDDQSSQMWGGVVLLGRAPVTDCLAPGAAEGTVACERDTEGTSNALYGGAQPTDNSGRMSYVQIRYSGFILSADKELQGLTPSGVGSGTQLDHIQIHNSSDDGMEVFGGRPNFRYIVLTGNEDDNIDTDVGYKGYMQFVIAVQRAGGLLGDAIIEADSNGNEDAKPRQNTRISNFTFIERVASNSDAGAILLRGGTDYTLVNGILSVPTGQTCLHINGAAAVQAADPSKDELGAPVFNSVVFSGCSTPFSGTSGPSNTDVQNIFNAGTNNNSAFTSTLTGTFINGANETAVPVFDATTLNDSTGFFVKTSYIGAVKDAADTWYAGWTCNSATADFGSTSQSCTSLPTN